MCILGTTKNSRSRFCQTSNLDDAYKDGIFGLKTQIKNNTEGKSDIEIRYELLDTKNRNCIRCANGVVEQRERNNRLVFETN